MERCFSEAPAVHGISQFHCIEPTERGFVNCRLYSSQSSSQSEGPPEVFPYDSDLEPSCSGDATSSYEDNSEDEEEQEGEAGEEEEDEGLDKEEKERDEIESRNVVEADEALKEEAKNDNQNHCHNMGLGIPDQLFDPLNQPSLEYFLRQYKINEVEAMLNNVIGSSLMSQRKKSHKS